MTTESQQGDQGLLAPGGATVLLVATAAAVAVGAVLAVVGGVAAGAPAAAGAVVGTLLVVAVLAAGSLAVGLVARVSPVASLPVALLTYALQVVAAAAAVVALERSGTLGTALRGGWLAAGVVAGTVVWSVAQVVLFARARVPVYDLRVPAVGAEPSERPEAGAR